jgi:hypothetical protein
MTLVDEEALDVSPTRFVSFGAMRLENNNLVWPIQTNEVSIQTDLLRTLLRLVLEQVQVDERYYLRTYPDVGEAIEMGLFASPRHHFIEFGYFEDRLPFKIEVDEKFYFQAYPDVKSNVKRGSIPSAQFHFERNGYKEGRLPREGWSLLAS